MDKKILQSTITKFSKQKTLHALIGFDGFIDEIIHLVDKRQSPHEYTRKENMKKFSLDIQAAIQKSANFEMITKRIKLGGNGPIMANALLAQDCKISYFGALGENVLHPEFVSLSDRCERVISFADPGHTQALEFLDGKIMLGKTTTLSDISWENLQNRISLPELTKIISEQDLIAFTNWTMLSGMNSLITGFFNILSESPKRPLLFFDLADPTKRTKKDIKEVLTLISKMQNVGDVILGLNAHESEIVSKLLMLSEQKVAARAEAIRKILEISYVVIHPVQGAGASSVDKVMWVEGPFTKKPLITTGAGDNFNAGLCLGISLKMNIEEALMLGVCTSGFYVRNAHSPRKIELLEFMKKLMAEI